MNKLLTFLSFLMLLVATTSTAQIYSIKKTTENKVNNRINNDINNTVNNDIDRGLDAIFTAPGKIFRKVKNRSQQNSNPYPQVNSTPVYSNTNDNITQAPPPVSPVKVNQGNDFTSAGKIIRTEDFSTCKPGDFPETWLTNGSGEVRTVDGQEGQWLQISSDGLFAPIEFMDLPESFTLEFDAICNAGSGKDVHYIFYLYAIRDKVADFKETNYPGSAGIYYAFNPAAGEIDVENFQDGKAGIIDTHLVTELIKASLANKVHVAMARQKTKLTLFINGNRIFSSPTALPAGATYNAIKLGSFYMGKDDFMVVSNLKVGTDE